MPARGGFITQNPAYNPGGTGAPVSGTTAVEQLYNRLMGNMNISGVASGAGGANWSQQRQAYLDSGGGLFNRDREEQEREQQDRGLWSGRQRYQYNAQNGPEEGADYRKAGYLETLLANVSDMGKSLMNATGFSRNREQYGWADPRTLTSFAASVPIGPLVGMSEAVPEIAEFSGQNYTEHYRADDGTVYVKNDQLDPLQSVASGVNGLINLSAPFVNGAGDLLVTGASLGKQAAGNAVKNLGKQVAGNTAKKELGSYSQKLANVAEKTAAGEAVAKNGFERLAEKIPDWVPGGVLNRRTGGMRKADGTAPGPLKTIVSDAAGEAAEEAAQSYAEDIRFENFDPAESAMRALEAAGWGAAGGAMMSGAAVAGQGAIKIGGNKQKQDGTGENQRTQSDRFSAFYAPKNKSVRDQMASAADQRRQQNERNHNETPYMMSVKIGPGARENVEYNLSDGTTYKPRVNLGTMGLGHNELYSYYHAHEDGREHLAEAFGLNVQDIDNMFRGVVDTAREEANIDRLKRAIRDKEAKGGAVEIGVFRNPATPEYGSALVDITDIYMGNGFRADPIVFEAFKSDGDGDIMGMTFGGQSYESARRNGSAIRQLSLRDSADTNVDLDYATFRPSLETHQVIDDFAQRMQLSEDERRNLRSLYFRAYDARQHEADTGTQRFVNFFNTALSYADRNNPTNRRQAAREVEDLFEAVKNPGVYSGIVNRVVQGAAATARANQAAAEAAVHVQPVEGGEYGRAEFNTENNQQLGDVNHEAQVAQHMGLQTGYVNGTKGNPPFRQLASLIYRTHHIPLETLNTIFDPANDMSKVIAALIGLRNTGVEPENVISTMFREDVAIETRAQYADKVPQAGGKIRNASDWDAYQEIFTKVYNRKRSEYEQAIETKGYDEDFINIGEAVPSEVKLGEDHKPLPQSYARAFVNVHGDALIYHLFSFDKSNPFNDMTLRQTLNYLYNEETSLNWFDNLDGSKGLSEAFEWMIRDLNQRTYAASETLDGQIDEVVNQYTSVLAGHINISPRTNEAHIQPHYQSMYVMVQEFFTTLMSPETFDILTSVGLRNAAINTENGRALYMATDSDSCKNALLQIALATDFAGVLRTANDINRTTNPGAKQELAGRIIDELAIRQNDSPLHRAIFNEALQQFDAQNFDGIIQFLDRLMDRDRSFVSKVKFFNDVVGRNEWNKNESTKNAPLLIWALTNGNSETELAAYSTRSRRAYNSMNTASKLTYKKALAEADAFNQWVNELPANNINDDQALKMLRYTADVSANNFAMSTLGSFIVDNLDAAKPFSEKGTVSDPQAYLAATVENALFGGKQSFLEGVTGFLAGQVTWSQFSDNSILINRVLFDPKFSIQIIDDVNSGHIRNLNQHAIFEEALGKDLDDDWTPTLRDYAVLFQKFPELFMRLGITDTSVTQVKSQAKFQERLIESPLETIKKNLAEYRNDMSKWTEKVERKSIEMALINDPYFYGLVAHFMPGVTGLSDMEIYKSIPKAWNEAIDFFFALSSLDPNSTQYRTLQNCFNNNAIFGLLDQLSNQMEDQQKLVDIILRGDFDRSRHSFMLDSLLQEINDTLALDYFSRNFGANVDLAQLGRDAGVDISGMMDTMRRRMALQGQSQLIYLAMSMNANPEDPSQYLRISDQTREAILASINILENSDPQAAASARRVLENIGLGNQTVLQSIFGGRTTYMTRLDDETMGAILVDDSNSIYRPVSPFVTSLVEANATRLNADNVRDFIADFTDTAQAILIKCSNPGGNRVMEQELAPEFEEWQGDIRRLCNNVVTANGHDDVVAAVHELVGYANRLNGLLLNETLRLSKGGTQANVNSRGGTEMLDWMLHIERMEGVCRQAREDTAQRFGYERSAYLYPDFTNGTSNFVKMPELNFTDAGNSFLSENIITNAGSAPAASVITQNAMELGEIAALGLITADTSCDVQPQQMTYAQLRELLTEPDPNNPDPNRDWSRFNGVCFAEGENPDPLHSLRLTPEAIESFGNDPFVNDDTVFTVYARPRAGCPTGCCGHHSRLDFSTRAENENPIINLISRIIKDAKEALALRYKKNLSNADAVVHHTDISNCINVANRNSRYVHRVHTFSATNPDQAALHNAIMDQVAEYRLRFAKDIYAEWSNRGIGNVSWNDALEIAEFCCSSVHVTNEAGYNRVISLNWLDPNCQNANRQDSLETVLRHATDNGLNAISVDINVMSLGALSNRVGDALARWKSEHRGRTPTANDLNDLAYVLTDYSDVLIDDDSFTVSDALNGVSMLTIGASHNVRLSSSETKGQRMEAMDRPETKININSAVPSSVLSGKRLDSVKLSHQDRSVRYVDGQGHSQKLSNPHEQITAVFDSRKLIGRTYEMGWADTFSGIAAATKEDRNGDTDSAPTGLVLAVTPEDVVSAHDYAKKKYKDLVIPVDTYKELSPEVQSSLCQFRNRDYQVVIEDSVRCYIFDIQTELAQDLAPGSFADLEIHELNPEFVFYQMADVNNVFNLIDAGCIGNAAIANNLRRTVEGDLQINPRDLFRKPGNRRFTYVTRQDIRDGRIRLEGEGANVDLSYWQAKPRNKRSQEMLERMREYLRDVQDPAQRENYSRRGFFKQRDIHRGECIGFIKLDQCGAPVYAPIFVDNTFPPIVHFAYEGQVGIHASDGLFHLPYQENIVLQEGDEFKSFPYGIAGKYLGTMDMQEFPTPFGGYAGSYGKPVIGMIRDGKGDAGRSFGAEDLVKAQNFFIEMAVNGGSIFFHRDTNGDLVPNETLVTEALGGDWELFWRLVNGDIASWKRVANRTVQLAGPESVDDPSRAKLNKIYSELASRCIIGHKNASMALKAMFSTIEVERDPGTNNLKKKPFVLRPKMLNVFSLFGDFTMDEILMFYHHMDLDCSAIGMEADGDPYSYYCPNGIADPRWLAAKAKPKGQQELTKWRWNDRGAAYVEMNGTFDWYNLVVSPPTIGTETSLLQSVKGNASYSYEHKLFDLLDMGLLPQGSEFTKLIDYILARSGHFEGMVSRHPHRRAMQDMGQNIYGRELDNSVDNLFNMDQMSFLNADYQRKCEDLGRKTYRNTLMVTNFEGELSPQDLADIKTEIAEIKRLLKLDYMPSIREAVIWYQNQIGFSRTEALTANDTVTKDQLIKMLKLMQRSIQENNLLINAGIIGDTEGVGKERVPIPLLPLFEARKLFEHSELLQQTYGDLEGFVGAMRTELRTTEETIEKDIVSPSKRVGLYRLIDYLLSGYGEQIPFEHVFRERSVVDRALIAANYRMWTDSDPDLDAGSVERILEAQRAGEERLRRHEEYLRSLNKNTVEGVASTRSGASTSLETQKGFLHGNLWAKIANVRKVMGLANPLLAPINFLGRAISGYTTDFLLTHSLSQRLTTLYGRGIEWSNPMLPRQLGKKPAVLKYFNAMTAAAFDGNIEQVQALKSEDELDAYLDQQKKANSSLWKRIQQGVFNFAGGFNAGRQIQVRVFLNKMAQMLGTEGGALQAMYGNTYAVPRLDEQGQPVIDERTGQPIVDEVSELEMALQQDPVKTLSELFSGPAGEMASQAWNFAMQGDLAQRNVVSEIVGHICGKYGAVNFFTTVFVSPYFTYATNFAGRLASVVAPVSSLHYLVTERLAQSGRFEDMNLRDIQTRRSLKEAIIADVCHIGGFWAAMALVSLAGLIPGFWEPPEDEDLILNVNEWRFCGLPIDTIWGLDDILCLALPAATAWRAIEIGKGEYAPQLIVSSFANIAYNFPLFSLGNIIDGFMDDVTALSTGSITNESQWEKAPSGAPNPLQQIANNSVAGTLNFFGQFFTPSILRELWNDFPGPEKSYKIGYKHDANGQVIIDQDTLKPETERLDYLEAQLHKVTRNNPIMGLLLDGIGMMTGNRTDYLASQMPDVHYYEPIQIWSANHYSLTNEDGTEKSDEEKQAIAFEVIATLNSTDDMEALWKSGFYIPVETKLYVGQVVWDIVNAIRRNYNDLDASGALDYHNFGDYQTGNKIKKELYQTMTDECNAWKSFFDDKLWSEEMRRPMVTYTRMRTTYQQDINGEWYGTGYPKGQFGLFPIVTQQGVPTGVDEFGNSLSVLDDSITTGMRGLVPVDMEFQEKPDFEDMAKDDDKENDSGAPTGTTGNPFYDNRYGGSYGGYGGYGGHRRSGGGGGGGGRPSIRSFSPSLNISYPTTMNPNRWYGSQVDYLRPSFETKGSREASRREDF